MIAIFRKPKRERKNKIKEAILLGRYKDVYDFIIETHHEFSLDVIAPYFSGIPSIHEYCFMLYALAREETAEKYLMVCWILEFEYPFDEYNFMIRVFALESMKKFPEDLQMREWIVSYYEDNPCELFSDEELKGIKEEIRSIRATRV